MSNKVKAPIFIVVIALVLLLGIWGIVSLLSNSGKTDSQLTYEDTVKDLNRFVEKNVDVVVKTNPTKGNVNLDGTKLEDELPEIDTHPFKVKGTGAIDIEIFSSPEKAGSETSNGSDEKCDVWLIETVKNFNAAGYTIDGKTVSVSLRSVSSGLAMDYISSGKYVPDGFSPSNADWASMLKAKGVTLTEEAKSLVGNVAGIVIGTNAYDELISKYGVVNMDTVIEATVKGDLAMGYTNPYASSTGLNFLMTSLYNFDSNNPLSDKAISGFQSFQANVPVVSYNTRQMKGAINSGALKAMILEYQSFVNTPELANYKFIPFGVRHDNPLYSIGNLSAEKQQAFQMFAEFATNAESQKSAEKYGFNSYSNYVPEVPETDGKTLLAAQQLWKEEKDGDQEIVAVFIVDTSGSVSGTPLAEMKESLINAAQYIKPDNSYVGLVSYNSNVTINLPIGKFDLNQRAYFNGEVSNLVAGGGTHTFDAIAVGLQMLTQAKEAHPNAKFMLFVLSDGESNGSLSSVSGFIENLHVPVHTIGYNANVKALREISSIQEGASINAATDDIIYQLKGLFNSQM